MYRSERNPSIRYPASLIVVVIRANLSIRILFLLLPFHRSPMHRPVVIFVVIVRIIIIRVIIVRVIIVIVIIIIFVLITFLRGRFSDRLVLWPDRLERVIGVREVPRKVALVAEVEI